MHRSFPGPVGKTDQAAAVLEEDRHRAGFRRRKRVNPVAAGLGHIDRRPGLVEHAHHHAEVAEPFGHAGVRGESHGVGQIAGAVRRNGQRMAHGAHHHHWDRRVEQEVHQKAGFFQAIGALGDDHAVGGAAVGQFLNPAGDIENALGRQIGTAHRGARFRRQDRQVIDPRRRRDQIVGVQARHNAGFALHHRDGPTQRKDSNFRFSHGPLPAIARRGTTMAESAAVGKRGAWRPGRRPT